MFEIREYLHYPPAFVLLAASVLKGYQIATLPYPNDLLLESRLLTFLMIVLEVGVAAWLLSNWMPISCRRVGYVLFSFFFLASFINVLGGRNSCGCFGAITVHPMTTLLVDLMMAAFLIGWRSNKNKAIRISFLIPLVLALILPIGYGAFTLKTVSLSDIGSVVGDEDLIVVECKKWPGKVFPLIGLIDSNDVDFEGDLTVVLFHESCPRCQELIRSALTSGMAGRTLFVEVPPYSSPSRQDRLGVEWRRLTDKFSWFVETPRVIRLRNGTVVSVD